MHESLNTAEAFSAFQIFLSFVLIVVTAMAVLTALIDGDDDWPE
jgi:hypothetical protein